MAHEHTHSHESHALHSHSPLPNAEGKVLDPVCGMTIDPATAKGGSHVHKGAAYYFCNPKCRERFAAEPGKYLEARSEPEPVEAPPGTMWICPMDPEVREDHPGACPKCGMALEPEQPVLMTARTEWVCPMHPEIVRNEPGACPICGMALEPRTVLPEERPDPELLSMTRRFWVGLVLSLPLFFLGMSDLIPGQPVQHAVNPRVLAWVSSCWRRRWCSGAAGPSSSAAGPR